MGARPLLVCALLLALSCQITAFEIAFCLLRVGGVHVYQIIFKHIYFLKKSWQIIIKWYRGCVFEKLLVLFSNMYVFVIISTCANYLRLYHKIDKLNISNSSLPSVASDAVYRYRSGLIGLDVLYFKYIFAIFFVSVCIFHQCCPHHYHPTWMNQKCPQKWPQKMTPQIWPKKMTQKVTLQNDPSKRFMHTKPKNVLKPTSLDIWSEWKLNFCLQNWCDSPNKFQMRIFRLL